jgi:hypothetical protein
MCPEGQVVVAYDGRAGWWFDGFTFSCAPLELDCATMTYGVGTVAPLPAFGGAGGEAITPAACPTGMAAVGASIGEGYLEGTGYITAFGLACRPLEL